MVDKEFYNVVWSLCLQIKDAEASDDGGRFIATALFLKEGEVNCTRLIRGLIVASLFRQAF